MFKTEQLSLREQDILRVSTLFQCIGLLPDHTSQTDKTYTYSLNSATRVILSAESLFNERVGDLDEVV